MMRPLVDRQAPTVCDCHDCVLAGCDQPPVRYRRTRQHPARWVHGRELSQYWEAVARAAVQRQALGNRLRADRRQGARRADA